MTPTRTVSVIAVAIVLILAIGGFGGWRLIEQQRTINRLSAQVASLRGPGNLPSLSSIERTAADTATIVQGEESEVQSFQKQLNDIEEADSGTPDVQTTLTCLWFDIHAILMSEPSYPATYQVCD